MKIFAISLFLALGTGTSSAQLPTVMDAVTEKPVNEASLAKAHILVEEMRLRERFAPAFADRTAGNGKLLDDCIKKNADPAAPPSSKGDCFQKLAEFHERLNPIANRLAPQAREKLIEAVATIYARNFSGDELDQLIVFYRSPIGKRYAAAAPAMDKQMQAATRDVQLQFMIDTFEQAAKGKP